MNSIKLNVEAVSQNKRGWSEGELIKRVKVNDWCAGDIGGFEIAHTDSTGSMGFFQSQYLYFTSNDRLKFGDYFINGVTGKVMHYDNREMEIIRADKKIEFTTDPQCKTPGIPESFIKAYAESNGSIKEVRIEAKVVDTVMNPFGGTHEVPEPRIVNNECVIDAYSFGDKVEIEIVGEVKQYKNTGPDLSDLAQKAMDKILSKISTEKDDVNKIITNNKAVKMLTTPVSGSVCKSYGWSNDSMGEMFDDATLYKAVFNESESALIIIPQSVISNDGLTVTTDATDTNAGEIMSANEWLKVNYPDQQVLYSRRRMMEQYSDYVLQQRGKEAVELIEKMLSLSDIWSPVDTCVEHEGENIAIASMHRALIEFLSKSK